MKVSLNLAVHQSAHERYALYWATPVALGALVALAYLTASVLRTFREYHRVHRSVAECQAQQRLLHDREQAAIRRLQQPDFQGVLRRASYVNSLIDQRQLSLTGLTAKLTRLLPADVRLTTLSLSGGSEGPLVRMTIESSNQEKVIAFVQNLEQSSDFRDPVISSEDPGQQGGGGKGSPGGVARVICTADYSGWQTPEAVGSEKGDNDEDEPALVSSPVRKAADAPKAPSATQSQQSKKASRPDQRQVTSDPPRQDE